MSDPLEKLLREMPLRSPSEAMDERVLGAIDAARQARMKVTLSWLALVAAAAIAFAFFLAPATTSNKTSSTTASTPALQGGLAGVSPEANPVAATDAADTSPIVIARTIEQLIDTGETRTDADGQTPVRVYTRKTVRQEYWIDPVTLASIERTTPSEETVLVQQAMY